MHLRCTISDNNLKQEKNFYSWKEWRKGKLRKVEQGGGRWSKVMQVEDKEVLPLTLFGIKTLFKLIIKIYLLFHNVASIKISRIAAVMQFNYLTAVFSLVYQLKQHTRETKKRDWKRKQGRVEWFKVLKDTESWKVGDSVHFDVKSTTERSHLLIVHHHRTIKLWGSHRGNHLSFTFMCKRNWQIDIFPDDTSLY